MVFSKRQARNLKKIITCTEDNAEDNSDLSLSKIKAYAELSLEREEESFILRKRMHLLHR